MARSISLSIPYTGIFQKTARKAGFILSHSFVWAFVVSVVFYTPSSAEEPVTVTTNRPVVPDFKARGTYAGITFVSTEDGLERVVKGAEPRTVQELLALEKQQEKVAAEINSVTVNIQQGTAQGSGVIITPDGYVLTAAHVAGKPGRDATVVLSDGRRIRAKTLGTNRTMDAGLIKIEETSSEPWPHASLGKSEELKLGQWVIAAGHPGGWMSDRPAVVRVGRILNIMKSTLVSDCTLIGGDSGGPLFDLNGRLIGIHSRIGTETADNMHVPIDVYRDSWDKMAASQAWGTLPGYKPVIGVVGKVTTSGAKTAEIARVIRNSPADRVGLQEGDIVVNFDDTPITTFEDLQKAVEGSLPGDRVTIEVERNGKRLRMRMVVGIEDP